MKINDFKDLNLPKKYDEEYRKVDFAPLFSYDFKNVKTYEFDIMGLTNHNR